MPYLDDLDESYPDGDSVLGSAIDDDLRELKETVLDSFPNITGEVTVTHEELNHMEGATSSVDTQLTNLSDNITTNADKSYMVSGWTIGGGTYLPAGWAINTVGPGHYRIIHNMNATHGLGANDYIVSATPYMIGKNNHPLIALEQDVNSFDLFFYNHYEDRFNGATIGPVYMSFVFLMVII